MSYQGILWVKRGILWSGCLVVQYHIDIYVFSFFISNTPLLKPPILLTFVGAIPLFPGCIRHIPMVSQGIWGLARGNVEHRQIQTLRRVAGVTDSDEVDLPPPYIRAQG
jgi:hypothetical protein